MTHKIVQLPRKTNERNNTDHIKYNLYYQRYKYIIVINNKTLCFISFVYTYPKICAKTLEKH